ncbi:MAG TPA: VOC family protein [Deferrisomatales bacterium]|nr:VOC family protein [Deferrisomatales bacterium]
MEIRTANTILYCARWQETVTFYRSVLGLRVTHETDWFVEFALGEGVRVSVADAGRATVASAGGRGVTLSLQVTDVAAARDELAAAGLDPTELQALWGARVSYLHDPEGHRIEIWS